MRKTDEEVILEYLNNNYNDREESGAGLFVFLFVLFILIFSFGTLLAMFH